MGTLFFLLALIIGVVVTLILIMIIFILVSGGVISASVLVGLQQKSLEKGFKTFLLLISVIGCTIVSGIFFWLANNFKDWWPTDIAIIAGIICGIVSGWILGLIVFQAIKKLTLFLKNKYEDKINKIG